MTCGPRAAKVIVSLSRGGELKFSTIPIFCRSFLYLSRIEKLLMATSEEGRVTDAYRNR